MNARLTATLSRLVMSFALGLGLVLGLIAFVHAPSLAAPAWRPLLIPGNPVVMPRANSHTAPRNTTVAITYSEAISAATVNTRTFAVHAMQTGQLTRSFGALGGSIILTPTRLFKPGELVQASATTRTLNLLGQGPISPTVWQFRAAAGPGPGIFLDSGQRMGLSFTLGVALGDLNGDGSLDALVTNFDQGDQVWLNNGAGLFTDSGQSLPGTSSQAIALGDLNGDGDLDAVVGSKFDVTGTIWFNNGSGLFVDSGQTLILSETSAIALGDLNGDGALDAFVGNMNSYDFGCLPDPCPLSGGSQVWLNNGSGFLTASGPVLGFGSNNISVALGDVNGDGSLDALVGNQATQWTSGNWGGGETSVWLNNGSGVFTAMTPTLSLTSTTRAVALGDLNGDGDLDALVGNFLGPTQVYFNNGAGVFTNTGQTLGISATVSVALGDVDGDGDLDAVIGNDGEPKTVWLNDGTGTFIANGQVLAAENTTALALGDLNGDGNLDIFAANAGEGAPNTIWFNTNEFTAQDDQFTVLEDQLANVLNVLANDHTPTGTLSLLNVGAPNHGGNVVISATTLVYTPAVDYNGFESFTYTLQNTAGLTAIAWVTATILAVNDPPSFAKGTDRIVSEDAGQQVVASWATNIRSGPVTALDEAGQALTFTLTSNNATLFAGPLQLNTAGTLTYIPAANAFGSATVIAALRDEGGTLNGGVDTFSATFHITVTAVNDPPTLNPISDRVISGSLQTQVITLTGISAGPNEMEPVSVTAISTNTAMLPQPTVVYTSPNTTGLLQITPSAGQSGTANVIVTVNDGLLQTSRTFQVTVNPSFFVVTTDPAGLNQIVQPTQSITATFSMPPNASTVNTRTFQVYGQQT
ncbi:MAG TPA: FG-GAP-like repeat-containing protein, partial [Anaerolineae bacterium]|nr:FG-GAP-like repeat-containing protein [Anaerolineae bacterium]